MNNIINLLIDFLNKAGHAFCDFSLTMFVQASVLIVLLLVIDILIRRRVRATFRYWIWMLVFIKLILPPALSLPTGIGNWFGEYFVVNSSDFDNNTKISSQEPAKSLDLAMAETTQESSESINTPIAGSTQISSQQFQRFNSLSRPVTPRVSVTPEMSPAPQVPEAAETASPTEPALSNAISLTWQGGVFLIWLMGVLVLSVLLIQRIFFIRGLISQSEPAKNRLLEALHECSKQLGIRKKIQMKLSYNASSPAVCGIFKQVILIPRELLGKISHDKFKAILIHELSHIKRNDLLINCAQTLLQIIYFYNPLVWIANSIVRRIREQAVDEMVLVALGAEAKSYSNTLIDVAEMAFSRPTLSLRLVGVVESKKALSERIKHILSRPIPKSAKLGLIGLIIVVIAAAILLPMAGADSNRIAWYDNKTLIKFKSQDNLNGTHRTEGDTKIYSKNYEVVFRKGEKLLVFAELYETGKPMRRLGHKIFDGTDKPQKLLASFTEKSSRQTNNSDLQDIKYRMQVQLGDDNFDISTSAATPVDSIGGAWSWFQKNEISKQKINKKIPACRIYSLFSYTRDTKKSDEICNIWVPCDQIGEIGKYKYVIKLRMVPLSQIEYVLDDIGPMGEYQLPDGSIMQGNGFDAEKSREQYMQSIMSMIAPLPKLTAHQYCKIDEPIQITALSGNSGGWKPTLDEIYRDDDKMPVFFLIDGKEYDSRLGFGPFGGGGMKLTIPGDLYLNLNLPVGKHTAAYGWRNVDVTNPDEPEKTFHIEELITDEVEFEIVREIPGDYYKQVYEEGWDKTLADNVEVLFTDDIQKLQVAGAFLVLAVKPLPFEIAFDVYAQAEGSEEREYVTQLARKANPAGGNYILACDNHIESLNWDNVGQKRYRLILVPSEKAAISNPPIRHYYGKEYITDWATFEKSERFEQHYQAHMKDKELDKVPRYGGTIEEDKPVDLDRLSRRWAGDSNESQPPDGFELGWSPENGGILKINPDSDARMLWFPEANASLVDPEAETKARLEDLSESTTTEINPPKGERTLIAVRSSENKTYFVQVSKVNEQWANLSWWPNEEPKSKDFKVTLPSGAAVELIGVCEYPSEGKRWWMPDGSKGTEEKWPASKIEFEKNNSDTSGRFIEVAWKCTGPDEPKMLDWSIDGQSWAFEKLTDSRGTVYLGRAKISEKLEEAELNFVVAHGKYGDPLTGQGQTEVGSYIISDVFDGSYIPTEISKGKKEGRAAVNVALDFYKLDMRVRAKDIDNNWHTGVFNDEWPGPFFQNTYLFEDLPLDEFDYAVLETRGGSKIGFKDVSLKEGESTKVKTNIVTLEDKKNVEEQEGDFGEFYYAGDFLLKGGKRAKAAEIFLDVAQKYPNTSRGESAQKLSDMLAVMAQEDRQFLKPRSIESLSINEKINYYIYKLRDVAEQEIINPGNCNVLSFVRTPDSAALALRRIGKPAVPSLISILEDMHPTRSVTLPMNGATVLRYCDVALQVLEAICAQQFGDLKDEEGLRGTGIYLHNIKNESRERIISNIKTWWDNNKDKDESQWIRDSLTATGISNYSYRIELAQRLIELEGAKSIEFFRSRLAAEPDNERINTLLKKAEEGADSEKNKTRESQLTATLPSGVTVDLLGVSDVPAEGKQWWAADGSPIKNVYWEGTTIRENYDRVRQVVFSIAKDSNDPDIEPSVSFNPKRHNLPEGPSFVGSFIVSEPGSSRTIEDLRGLSFSLNDEQDKIDIEATVGYGQWQTQGTKNTSSIGILGSIGTKIGTLIFNDPTEANGITTITATLLNRVEAWRIIAIDKQGKTHKGSSTSGGFDIDAGNNIESHQLFKAEFSLPLNEIEKFKFQTRKVEKFTFKNVSLERGLKTDVQVEVKKNDEQEQTDIQTDSDINFGQPSLFTLSDAAIMSLDTYGGTSRIIDKRDTPGPGVEFDIYFPPGGDSLSYSSSKAKGKGTLTNIDLNKYIGYSLKFTLLDVKGKGETPNIDKARLGVGANIGSPGRYRPAFFYLSEKNKTVISSTSLSSVEIQSFDFLGFTAYLLGNEFTNSDGLTITLKIEATPGAKIIDPQLQEMIENAAKKETATEGTEVAEKNQNVEPKEENRLGDVPAGYLVIYLPDMDTADANVVLDFATGQMLSAKPVNDDEKYFDKIGKGDLAYEYARNQSGLLCLRGARLELITDDSVSTLTPDVERENFAVYFVNNVPGKYRITTAEGGKYEFSVVSINKGDTGGAYIDYRKPAGAPDDSQSPKILSDTDKKNLFSMFLIIDTNCESIVSELEKGDVETAKKHCETVEEVIPKMKALAESTEFETIITAGAKQFDLMYQALKDDNINNAKTYLNALMQLGNNSSQMFQHLVGSTNKSEQSGAKAYVPAAMVGTWFFENPLGDDEQMAIFSDGRVVVLYSNGQKDQTRYENGVIELAGHKLKMNLLENGMLIEYGDSEESGLAKIWRRIDTQPHTELLKPLTGDDSAEKQKGFGPVDFEGYFENSAIGARELEKLWNDRDKDLRDADEILEIVRKGLRRYRGNGNILRWIGNLFIWGKNPQNEKAIELMYHASGSPDRNLYGDAIYFGLSVTNDKTPEIMKAMVAVAMKTDDYFNVTGRILWGCRSHEEELIAYLEPYLNSDEASVRQKASDVKDYFTDSDAFMKKRAQKREESVREEYGDNLEQYKDKMLSGNSKTRLDTLNELNSKGIMSIVDESFIDAFEACAKDSDSQVRNRAARMMGNKYVWGAQPQNQRVIEILTVLLDDPDRSTRYSAVYYGLSTIVPDKELVEKMLATILDDREINYYGRVIWGIRRNKQACIEVLEDWMNHSEQDTQRAVKAYEIYEDVTGELLPKEYAARFTGQKSDAHEGIVAMCFKAEPIDREQLQKQFIECLADSNLLQKVRDFYIIDSRETSVGMFICDNLSDRNAIREALMKNAGFQVAGYIHGAIGPTGSGFIDSMDRFKGAINYDRIKLPVISTNNNVSTLPVDSNLVNTTIRDEQSTAENDLQQMIDSAEPEATIIVPNGKYTEPVEITKPLILKGQSRTECIFEVTADKPAIFINAKSKGKVTIDGVTIKWQLASSDQNENPYAVGVKDTVVEIRNCSIEPLGNFKRSPVAIYSLGFSELTIDTCRFEGFEYTVCFGEGSKGTIQNCLVMDSGHQGITLYAGADVKVLGNVVTGSGYHGVRSTGGTLDMKDNLIINNKNRGVYLGNRSALGTIENNVIIGNGTGISGFAQSNVTIQRNVIADTGFAGIDMRDSCRLSIRDNIIKGNDRGLALFKESGTNTNKTYRNTFWQNKTETENISPSEDSLTSDPLFNDAANGDFSLKPGPVLQAKQGLENPETFIKLWKKWKNRADKNEPFAETNANKKQDGLEFRIAPDSVEPSRNTSLLTPEQELKYKEDLRQNGPEAGSKRNDEYIWLLLRDELPSTFPITQEYRGRRYLLVCNRKPFIMLLDGSWDIKQIREVSDNMSMPAISLEFDQKVGEQFYQLTSSNIKRSLAIIFDGVVIAAPTIESATRSKVMITGSFTEDEIQTMIKALKDDISS